MLLAIHADQLAQHGGSGGIREPSMLDSALGRVPHRWTYAPNSGLPRLAAAYGYSLTNNHPFVDGNKRVAFQAMYVSLGLNGRTVTADEAAVVDVMRSVASGELSRRNSGNRRLLRASSR